MSNHSPHTTTVSFRIPNSLYLKVKDIAESHGASKTDVLVHSLSLAFIESEAELSELLTTRKSPRRRPYRRRVAQTSNDLEFSIAEQEDALKVLQAAIAARKKSLQSQK